jgi:hypothetical protein
MKYHLILSGWLLTKQMQQVLLRIWKNQNLGTLLVETQNGAAVMKISIDVPQNNENRTTIWPRNANFMYCLTALKSGS